MAHERDIVFLDALRENKWLRFFIGDLKPGFRLNTAGFGGYYGVRTASR
jgi:hypothetical protein